MTDDKGLSTAPSAGPLAAGPSVKSALRAVQVFEFFLQKRGSATAKEIADGLGIPQSSTSMLLRSLRDHGYLDYDVADRTFLPTPRVTLLGAWLDGGPIRDGRLVDAIDWLSDQTGQAVVVAARIGIFVHYIYVIQGRTKLRYHIPIGSRRLSANSATGDVLLGHLSEAEITKIVHRTNAEIQDVQIDRRTVLERVSLVKQVGYSFSRGLVTPDAGAIAVLLPPSIDAAARPLAVSIAGPLQMLESQEAELVSCLRKAADRAA